MLPQAVRAEQIAKEVMAYSKEEMRAMLLECKMDGDDALKRLRDEAVNRFQISRRISEGSFQKVKFKHEKEEERAREIDGGIHGGGGGDMLPPAVRARLQMAKEVLAFSNEEIYAVLQECKMDRDEALKRLQAEAVNRFQISRRISEGSF